MNVTSINSLFSSSVYKETFINKAASTVDNLDDQPIMEDDQLDQEIDEKDDSEQVKDYSPSSPQKINATIDKLMDQLNKEIDAKTNDEQAKFDDICALVNQILALLQANQKKLTSELSRLHARAREHHLNNTLAAHSSKTITILAVTSASFHALAGASHLAPGAMLNGAGKINDAVSFASKGKFSGVFDLARFSNSTPEGQAGIVQAASGVLGGLAKASESGQSIAGDRRQGKLQEHSSRSDHAKTDKQELDQEVSAAGSRADAAINAAKDHEEKRHRAMQAIMGG